MSADWQLEDTVYLYFTTRQFSDGVPTALVSGVVDIYEDATATPIVTAETLTASLNGHAGFNVITITATAASGFNAGGSYAAVMDAGTVGGTSVIGEVVGTFTLDKSAAAKDLANATDGLSALKTLIDTVDDFLDTEIAAITAAVITNAAGVDIAADIIALKAETVLIVADTNELQVDNVPGLIATAQADLDIITGVSGVNLLTATQASIDAIEADTNELQVDNVPGLIATAQADLDILTGTDGVTLATAQGLYAPSKAGDAMTLTAAAVDLIWDELIAGHLTADSAGKHLSDIFADTNELITDDIIGQLELTDAVADSILALLDNARGEPAQGAPPVNPDMATKVDYLYKFLRNKIETTATQISVYDDAGAVVDHKSTISDDATTFTRGEIATGP